MKRLSERWPRKVLLSWIISYLIVLIIPIVVSIGVYIQSYSVIEKEITRANTGILKQVQQEVEAHLQEIQQLSTQLTLHAEVEGLLYWSLPLTDNQKYMMVKTQQTFKTYSAVNQFIDSFSLILLSSRQAVTDNSIYSELKQYHRMVFGTTDLTYDKWIEFINQRHNGNYVLLSQVSTKSYEAAEPFITYVRSLPLNNPTGTLAKLTVNVKQAKFNEMLEHVGQVNQGMVMILDRENQLIASTQSVDPEQIASILSRLKIEDHLINDQLNGEEVVISRLVSDTSKWQYITVTPSRIFWEKSEKILYWIYFGFILCLVAGGLAAYYMARRQYHPVGELVQLLSSKARQSWEASRNEFQFIKETMHDSFTESELIHRQLKQQNEAMRSNFLFRLLKGRLEASYPIEEALSMYDLRFQHQNYAVAAFYFEDFSELFRDSMDADTEMKIKFVQHIVRNIVEELANKHLSGYMTDYDDNMMVLLFNVTNQDAEATNARIMEVANEAQQFITSRFYIYFTVSVSTVHYGFPGIPLAYEEAMEALEYKMVYGTNRVIAYEQTKQQDTADTYYYPMDKEQQLVNLIKAGQYERAMETLDEIFTANLSVRAVPLEVSRCFMFDMIGTMMKTLEEIQLPDKTEFIQRWSPVSRLMRQETLQDMRREMEVLLRQVCEWIEENKKSHHVELYDRILQYIGEHYQDSSLSISSIAEEMGFSSGYLSRYFKEQHGESLLDYLNHLRLGVAKQLLADGKMTIAETAVTVGYYNSNAFIRTFKKYEGVTPGQYKDTLSK